MSDPSEATYESADMIAGTFVLTEDDAALLDRLNKEELLVLTFWGFFLFMLAGFVPPFVALCLAERTYALALCCLLFLAASVAYFLWFRELRAEAMRVRATHQGEIGFRLSRERIEMRIGQGWQGALWELVREIRSTETHLLISLRSTEWVAPCGTGYLIPYRVFVDREAGERCFDFCRQQFERAQTKPQAGPLLDLSVIPPDVESALQPEAFRFFYQHADDDGQTLNAIGAPRWSIILIGASIVTILIAASFLLYAGLTQVGEFEPMDVLHGTIIGAVATFLFSLSVRSILAHFFQRQLPALANPIVTVILSPAGLLLSTGYSISYVPAAVLPSLVERPGFLMLIGMDGVVRRTIPWMALGSADKVRRFREAYDAARDGRVIVETVNVVPPSANPYRSPETD